LLVDNSYLKKAIWPNTSLILTSDEGESLFNMTQSTNGTLLYRATRDGFTALAFHEKCDGKANTVTIIKTNGNYVFGGYTSAKWNSDLSYSIDASAFIFSLRRDGISKSYQFKITKPQYAIFGGSYGGPNFGVGDFEIRDRSDINTGSWTRFCFTYQCPSGYSFDEYTKSFLAGSYNKWLTSEIEVYQIFQ
jgi:hypothetical protein